MDYSVTAAVRWECASCGAASQGETDVITDTVARPDLARDLFTGDPPALECQVCSAAHAPRVPLLVYRSDEYTQLILFYPPQIPYATDEAARNSYTETLLDQLGPVSAEDAEKVATISLAQTGLAKVLCERGSQSGPAPIEEAVALLEEVTSTLDPADAGARETWCDAQSALAGACNMRQLGDPAVPRRSRRRGRWRRRLGTGG